MENNNRCFICKGQHRKEDLLRDYKKSCLLCGRSFCYPHHSGNPVEMGFGMVERAIYVVTWQRDWVSGGLVKGYIPQWELCLPCALAPPKRVLNPAEWDGLRAECQRRGLSRYCYDSGSLNPASGSASGSPLAGSS